MKSYLCVHVRIFISADMLKPKYIQQRSAHKTRTNDSYFELCPKYGVLIFICLDYILSRFNIQSTIMHSILFLNGLFLLNLNLMDNFFSTLQNSWINRRPVLATTLTPINSETQNCVCQCNHSTIKHALFYACEKKKTF